jgi:hypothetical protein
VRVDHRQGLMVEEQVILAAWEGATVTVDYCTDFPNNTVMVEESYHCLMAAKSWQVDLLDLPTRYTRRVSYYWLQAGIEHISVSSCC